MSKVVLSNNK